MLNVSDIQDPETLCFEELEGDSVLNPIREHIGQLTN